MWLSSLQSLWSLSVLRNNTGISCRQTVYTKRGSWDVQGILWTTLGTHVWWDTRGGSQDVQRIFRTAWEPVSERTSREDPGMSKGSSGQGPVSEGIPREDPGMSKVSFRQHGGLCPRGVERSLSHQNVLYLQWSYSEFYSRKKNWWHDRVTVMIQQNNESS